MELTDCSANPSLFPPGALFDLHAKDHLLMPDLDLNQHEETFLLD